MFKQKSSFFEITFSDNQCIFRQWLSAQEYFLTLLGKWKNSVVKGKFFRVLLTDLFAMNFFLRG